MPFIFGGIMRTLLFYFYSGIVNGHFLSAIRDSESGIPAKPDYFVSNLFSLSFFLVSLIYDR